MGDLAQFLAVGLGAVVGCVGAMDADKVVVEVRVCRQVVMVSAEFVSGVRVGWVAKAR